MVLLGNQLFSIEEIKKTKVDMIFMSEDYDLCTYEKHHKLKILMFLVAMREKRDELIASKYELDYRYLEETPFPQSYEEKLKACISNNDITEVQMFEIEDKVFEKRIIAFFNNQNVSLTFINSPMFLIKREDFSKLSGNSSSPRMAQFYKNVRKKLNILIDNEEKPVGGKWSFDDENRKKIPKTLPLPKLFKGTHLRDPNVTYHQISNFSIETKEKDLLNIDGELKGTTPINVKVMPNAVEILN